MTKRLDLTPLARRRGREAFERGLPRVPYLDLGPVSDSDLYRAWTEGWDVANLAAPLPDEEEI